jgi:hypothetical protein
MTEFSTPYSSDSDDNDYEAISVAEFTANLLSNLKTNPSTLNNDLPPADTIGQASDAEIIIEQQFAKKIKSCVSLFNLEGYFFEQLVCATEIFQLVIQQLPELYRLRPSKWYQFVIIIYGKAQDLLLDVEECGETIEMESDELIVTNFVKSSLAVVTELSPILIRNNYFNDEP